MLTKKGKFYVTYKSTNLVWLDLIRTRKKLILYHKYILILWEVLLDLTKKKAGLYLNLTPFIIIALIFRMYQSEVYYCEKYTKVTFIQKYPRGFHPKVKMRKNHHHISKIKIRITSLSGTVSVSVELIIATCCLNCNCSDCRIVVQHYLEWAFWDVLL